MHTEYSLPNGYFLSLNAFDCGFKSFVLPFAGCSSESAEIPAEDSKCKVVVQVFALVR